MFLKYHKAFTLAELLIALAVLGVIATFTLPKILLSQQNTQYNAAAKEAASMVSAAYSNYALGQPVYSSLRFDDFLSYMNYVNIDTASTIDSKYTQGSLSCNVGAAGGCLVLHNGGMIRYTNNVLAGTASTNAIEFYFDPNGQYSGTTNGPDKSVQMFIYYGGRITSRGYTIPNTLSAGQTYASPDPTFEPPWFSW
jgi:prepilin-type N-terminal cleavage/methylation domain-containing protein